MKKRYNVEFYTPAGAYLATLNETLRLSKISFGQTLNGGQGELTIGIKAAFDSPPAFASLNNFVKVYFVKTDNGTQEQRLVYSGFISQVRHVREGSNEFVEVKAQGLAALLALNLYKDGVNFDVVHTSVDPGAIVTDIVTKSNALTGSHFTTTGVDTVGVSVSDTFSDLTHRAAMERVNGYAGGSWSWFVGADGDVRFSENPATATHSFNLQKHVNSIEVTNSSESIANEANVGGATQTDATSIAAYYKRDRVESGIGADATARQQLADSIVADGKNPKLLTAIELNSTFDIEAVKPGDTCEVIGLKIGQTVLGNNLLIVATEYNEQTLRVTLEEKSTDFGAELARFTGKF